MSPLIGRAGGHPREKNILESGFLQYIIFDHCIRLDRTFFEYLCSREQLEAIHGKFGVNKQIGNNAKIKNQNDQAFKCEF